MNAELPFKRSIEYDNQVLKQTNMQIIPKNFGFLQFIWSANRLPSHPNLPG